MSDPRFSRAQAVSPGAPALIPSVQSPDMLIGLDPPAHTRLRSLVNKAFTYRAVERLRPRVVAIVAELIDVMAGQAPPGGVGGPPATPPPGPVHCEGPGLPAQGRGGA